MAEIVLTRGFVAVVDDDLFSWLNQWKWVAVTNEGGLTYARRVVRTHDGELHCFHMHRVIAGEPPGLIVDHRDGDTLNNRRANLRPATHQQNAANSRQAVGASGFRGVRQPDPCKGCTRFRACIQVAGRTLHLGTSETREGAARLYDAAALQHFGEFAVLNFPEEARQ